MTTLGPNTTPGTYEFQVQDLLHDPNFNRWNQQQIDYYINQARVQLVMDTGCLRSLQPAYLTQGQEQYFFGQVTGAVITNPGSGYVNPSVSFSGGGGTGAAATVTQSGGAVNAITLTNFGANYTSAPTALITDAGPGVGATASVGIMNFLTWDILGINLIWGTEKYALQWRPFRVFSAWLRPFTPAAYQRQPVAWAVYGDNCFFVGPVPDQSYAVEYDTIILPTDFTVLGDPTTVDPIPRRNQDPIKFWAAYLAKKNARAFGEAEAFKADYRTKMLEVVGAYTGRVPDVYQEG